MSLILSFGPIARPDLLTSCSTVIIFFLLLIYIQPMLAARPKIVIFHQAKQNFYGFFQRTYFRPRYHFYSQEASASMVLTVPWSSSLTSSTFCIYPHVLSVRIEGRQQASLSPPFGITSLWLRRLQQPYICHRILSLSVNILVYAI